jgi:hypothetical protein
MHAELTCHALRTPAELTGPRSGWAGWLTALAVVAVGSLVAGVAAFAGRSTLLWPFVWPQALDGPLRLGVAALIGVAITAVQRRSERAPHATSMHHAQILLCVSGAMMMVLINDSLARAFGIAGAASLVRFRTPVDDPRDAAVMFLLIGLGMASGLGAYALAAGGAAMVALFLVALTRSSARSRRSLLVDLVACGPAFPGGHVQRVFTRHGASLEIREAWFGDEARATYLATFATDVPLDVVHADLVAGGTAGLRAVSWEPARKRLL